MRLSYCFIRNLVLPTSVYTNSFVSPYYFETGNAFTINSSVIKAYYIQNREEKKGSYALTIDEGTTPTIQNQTGVYF